MSIGAFMTAFYLVGFVTGLGIGIVLMLVVLA